jgi:uncharacterized membrane protein YfcA
MLVVTIGATLQGSVGFGLGVFSVPLLLLIDPGYVPAPLLMTAVVLTVLMMERERQGVRVPELAWALSGRVVGIVMAAAALTLLSTKVLGIAFGALVLVGVGLSALGLRLEPTARVLVGAGVLSGFMGTTVSIGGPAIALVYQHESGPRLRGTLSAYFTAGVALSLVGLALVGRLGVAEIGRAGLLLPGVLTGFLISRRTAGFLDRGYIRVAVLVVSAATAVAVIAREVWTG